MSNTIYNKATFNGQTLIDLSQDTVTSAEHIVAGRVGHLANGTQVTGTATTGGTAAISVVDTTDTAGGTIRTITALDISDTTAVASDVAQGKYFYTAQGVKTAGAASGGGSSPTLVTKTITVNGTYNASSDNADGYSSVTVNVSGGGTPSATAHTIYFEFADSTNTTLTGYWNDSFISSAITATTPTTYNNKTVTLAQLDNVTWYEPANIPIGVELIDYTKVTDDYAIGSNGEPYEAEWFCATDYTVIDPSMTFSYTCSYWHNISFYNSSKTFIGKIDVNTDSTVDPDDSNVGHGTLTPAKIPASAMYVRLTGFKNPSSDDTSLIRTA